MIAIRTLAPGDEGRAEAFLAQHADTSMFLRSNLRAAGLRDEGEPLQGTYVAALEGERIVGIAEHAWNGMVLVQAPVALPELVRAATRATRPHDRPISGIAGPHAQVLAAREALGLGDRRTTMDSRERLYTLELAALRIPPALASGSVRARRSTAEDLELCARWREDYCVEALGMARDADLPRRARHDVEQAHGRGDAFVLESEGALVAYSAFNARLPDVVQVGGVWTPVALRRRGFGRAVVAGQLRIAASEGATRAVLFTEDDNVSAQRAYEAIGFEPKGAFGLVLFAP